MSLDKKAKQARDKADEIQSVALQIIETCDLVLLERKLNGETMKFTDEQKQKGIQHYGMLKTKIQGLVEALP